MKRQLILGVMAVVLVVGCNVTVEVPPESTVNEVKAQALDRLEKVEKALASGGTGGRGGGLGLKEFCEEINYLRGTLRLTGVGTEEDLKRFDEFYYHLARKAGDGGAEMPAHLEAGETPLVEAGDLATLLPQIRRAIEALPDSGLRPAPKGSR
ncbi:MAG TPA: hypothetical protein VNA25_27055 [Phycisphaerae bacterium]|nr:hypothetical protein [Phycisphaerae bacterium]